MKFKSPTYYIIAIFAAGYFAVHKAVEAFDSNGLGGVLAVVVIFFVGFWIFDKFKSS